jgi:UDP-2,4-diacetamido-2,4,6-trideoxy-beta-L-altropyranose hydrolase
MGTLLIRADASIAIGTGHVMRCLALAQSWQDAGGRVAFAMAEATAAIRERLADESCEVLTVSSAAGTPADAAQTIVFARERQAEWIVADGYNFAAEYQSWLKEAGCKLLLLDDYGQARHYCADLVLNQNVNANETLYANRDPSTRLLLGPHYCLLRREFAAWRDWKREVPEAARRILVTMGGSDPENITARVVDALASRGLRALEAVVVIGGSNPHSELEGRLDDDPDKRIRFRRDVTNIAELMAWADVAVASAGTTCWELCLLGLPSLLVDVAENQTELASGLDRRGCAIHVGDRRVSAEMIADQLKRLMESQAVRESLARRSRELVDGGGAMRVSSAVRGRSGIRLRRAGLEDRRLLFEWANDPAVRAASFSTELIPWDTHVEWFEKKIGQRESLLFIAEDESGTALGQIRFDVKDSAAELNLSLAKEKRGLGLSVPFIEAGVRELLASTECEKVHAFVKPQNAASGKAFEKAGFVRAGVEQVRGKTALHFVWERIWERGRERISGGK